MVHSLCFFTVLLDIATNKHALLPWHCHSMAECIVQYTYTYKYILTHVTKFENFWCLKGDKNLRCQLSNDCFQNSNDQFSGGSETHLPYSQTQMTIFWEGSNSHMHSFR